jgi:pyridoxal phosphate enzyme (YggS family)
MRPAAERIAANLEAVRARIDQACARSHRSPEAVSLVCVTKTLGADTVRAAHEVGLRQFGENYGQELRDKSRALADLTGLRWHFIGPLQRNKVKYVVGTACLIHTVASRSLLEEIDRRAGAGEKPQEVLVQLNLSGESTKSGILEAELEPLLESFAACAHVRCVGLMTMPPFYDDPDRARPLFGRLRELRDMAATTVRTNVDLHHLSMGMSGDFEVAIEEGATLVRIGTAITGPRT